MLLRELRACDKAFLIDVSALDGLRGQRAAPEAELVQVALTCRLCLGVQQSLQQRLRVRVVLLGEGRE